MWSTTESCSTATRPLQHRCRACRSLGYLARLCPAKGLATLVEAYLLLRKRDRLPGLRLRVAGSMTASDGPFVEQLRARLDRGGRGGRCGVLAQP